MRVVTLEQQAKSIERRMTTLGLTGRPDVAANDGGRRTESKRALLAAIACEAKKQGRKATFSANFYPPPC